MAEEWITAAQTESSNSGRQGTRASLRRVLAGRQLTPSKGDDTRIDACTDLATLECWLDRAITAVSVSDVLG